MFVSPYKTFIIATPTFFILDVDEKYIKFN